MIVVCGEALVDLIPALREQVELYALRLGGSPYNVAIGLSRLRTRTAFLGRLSRDFVGQLLRGGLLENGVDGRYLCDGPELSTLALVHLERGAEPEYLFYVENSADRNLQPRDLPETFPAAVDALHFGSISLVLEPIATTLEACMRREHGHRLISLDPNVRPVLIQDWQAYKTRLEGWLELADLVKVSHADLAWLYPGEPAERTAQDWLRRGARLVVVTRGAQGCTGFSRADVVHLPAVSVPTVDTVGAGDAFMSGLLARLDQRRLLNRSSLAALSAVELMDILDYANRAAALTCTRAGAEPPHLAEIERWAAGERPPPSRTGI